MLMNNLDPEVAENPELVVYGGIGRAARNWECYDRIVETLKQPNDDETLLVQSGKPVGVFKTHANAPRVLIANSNLVPHWATWEHFNELDAKGLAMYGQMTAGSWIYIGSQGIVQGTYETFVEAGRQHYDGNLKGRWVLTAGLGGMGGAQPLAATGRRLFAEHRVPAEPHRLPPAQSLRRRAGQGPGRRPGADPALHRRRQGHLHRPCWAMPPRSRNWFAAAYARTWSPTRPAPTIHSTATCRPAGAEEYRDRAQTDPAAVWPPSSPWRYTCGPCWRSSSRACRPSTMATTSARWPRKRGGQCLRFPGFVPAYIRPLFCRGIGPFRWAALSGDPQDIYKTDAKVKQLIPDDAHLHRWLDMARERISFQGRRRASAGWPGAARQARPGLQRDGAQRRACPRRSSSAATTSTPARWPAPTARPRPCRTAPTRCPTGRC